MATILYSRTKHQPEILYLPLHHGGFVKIDEGSHQYDEHVAYGLINSENPTVQHYISKGMVSVVPSGDEQIQVSMAGSVGARTFAPIDATPNYSLGAKIQYIPSEHAPVHSAVSEEQPVDNTPTSKKSAK
jgi:hypothetical protein